MQQSRAEVDGTVRQEVEGVLLLLWRLTLIMDAHFERAGLAELRSNRVVRVLTQLDVEGPQRPRELQGPVGLTSGGLTKLIDRLVALGVVERFDRGGIGDGRAVLVRLTRAGHAAARRISRTVADAHDDFRPLAKEAAQLAMAAGARPIDASVESIDLPAATARTGMIVLSALGDSDDAPVRDDFLALLTLCHLDLHELSRPGSLTDVLGLSSGGVSKLLDRLETQGLIARAYGVVEADRRAVTLRVTPAGHRRLETQIDRVRPYLDDLAATSHALAEGVSTPT